MYAKGSTTKTAGTVDLYISERPTEGKKQSGSFRFCTLSKSKHQKTINFRLPDEIQQKILQAYQQGKVVRVFA